MAGKNKHEVKKTSSNINSKWLQNTLKSLGMAGTEVIKDLMPATTDTASSAAVSISDSIKTLKSTKVGRDSIANMISKNPGVQMGKTFFTNAISDIKSGNFYNAERQEQALNSFMGMDEEDFSFGDMDEEGGNVTVNNVVQQDSGASLQAIQKQTEYTVKSAKATVDAMVSVSATQITAMSKIGSDILSELGNINSNIAALVEYNTTNMTKFINASIGYYEQMSTQKSEGSNLSSTQVDQNNIFSSSGGLDIKNYANYVKANIKDFADNSMVGGAVSMALMMKDNLVANPMAMIARGIMDKALPEIMKSSMKALDESVKDFIPVILERIGEYGDTDTGQLSQVSRALSSIFGIRTKRTKNIDLSKIEKGPVPWNGIANHTITEIIPKYLRESNLYLKEIAQAITGKDGDLMAGQAQGFDWQTGTYKAIEEMRDELYSMISNDTTAPISRSKFGRNLEAQQSRLGSTEEIEAYNKALTDLYNSIERHEGMLDLKRQDHYNEVMGSVKAPANIKNLIEASVQAMMENYSTGEIGSLANAKRMATQKKNASMEWISQNANENGARQIQGLGGYDEWAQGGGARVSKNATAGSGTVRNTSSVVVDIYNLLKRGIQVKTVHKLGALPKTTGIPVSGGGSTSTSDSGSGTEMRADKSGKAGEESGETISIEDYKKQIKAEASIAAAPDGGTKLGVLAGFLNGVMAGNADAAWDGLMKGVGDSFKKVGDFLGEHFLTPMKEKLFGTKNADGYISGGIFDGVNNRMKESFYSLRYMITGKGYNTADGETVADANDEELKNTVVGKLKGMLETIKSGIQVKLFGEKSEVVDSQGNVTVTEKEGLLSKASGKLFNAVDSFRLGLVGWKQALFGKDTDEDEDVEAVVDDLKKKAKEALPDGIAGGVVGALGGILTGGSLLGTLVGGPLGGVLLGFAGGIAGKSERFQKWLFGEKDEDGNRTGGLISKDTQSFFKEHGLFLAGSTALGVAKGALFPGAGMLTTLVGGPVAGALTGLAVGLVTKSKMFQKFIFGDPDEGQRGLKDIVSGWFKKSGSSGGEAAPSKMAGMLGIGTGAGLAGGAILAKVGLLGMSLGPAGPIGGALLGLGFGILSQKDNFHEWLFGKDLEDGTHKQGILGQFKNMLSVNVFAPIMDTVHDIAADAKIFLEYDILKKFNVVLQPVADIVGGAISKITGGALQSLSDVGAYIKEDFLNNIVDVARNIAAPVVNGVRTVAKGIYEVGKRIAAAPLNIISAITSPIARAIGSTALKVLDVATKGINALIVKPITNLVIKPLGAVVKGVGKVIAVPFIALGKVADFINEKVVGFISHVTKFITVIKDDIVGSVKKHIVDPAKKFFREKLLEPLQNKLEAAAEIVLAPIKNIGNLIKDKIHDVGEAVKISFKNAIKGAFSFLTAPFRLLGKGVQKLLGIGKGNEGTGLIGYVKQRWTDTGAGSFVKKEGMDVSTQETNRKRARQAKLEQAKQDRIDRKNKTYNRKLIAKYTGNQLALDTEENRKIAMAASGGKIKWKGDADDTQEKLHQAEIQQSTLENTEKQTDIQEETKDEVKGIREILSRISDFVFGGSGFESKEERNQYRMIAHNLVGTRAPRPLKSPVARNPLNPPNVSMFPDDEIIDSPEVQETSEDAAKKFKIGRPPKITSIFRNKKSDAIDFDDIDDWIQENILGNKDIPKHARGTRHARRGPAIVGEKGIEAVYRDGDDTAALVGMGGATLVNMEGGEKVVPNNKLGFDSGQSNLSTEDIVKASDETKLSIGERIIKGLSGVQDNTSGLLGRTLGGIAGVGKAIFGRGKKKEASAGNLSIGSAPSGRLLAEGLPGYDDVAKKEAGEQAQAEISDLKGAELRDQMEAIKEDESDDATQEGILASLKNLVKGQKEHSSVWNSIFSKKGLITGALLLAAPLIMKGIQWLMGGGLGGLFSDLMTNITNGLGAAISNIFDQFSFTNNEDAREDGDTVEERLEDNVQDIQDNNIFSYNEDGTITNQTESRLKLATRLGLVMANSGKKGLFDSKATKLVRKAGAVVKGVGKAAATVAKTVGKGVSKAASKVGSAIAGSKLGTKAAGGAAKVAEKLATTKGGKMLSYVIDVVTKFMDNIAAKCGVTAAKAFKKLSSSKIGSVISKHFTKISAKVSAIAGGKSGLAAATAGISEAVFITFSAINGASGAAKLFHVEKADGKMIMIAGVLGAITGTTVGSIVEVVAQLISDVLGVDLLCSLATGIYNVIANEEDSQKLEDAQQAFQDAYVQYQDEEIKKQYETQLKAGMIDKSVTYEMFAQGVSDGTYAVSYQGFDDWNTKQNMSIGDKIANKAGTLASSFKDKFISKSTDTYTDDKGNVYTKQKDGDYSVTSASGEELGSVSADAINKDTWSHTETKKLGVIGKAGNLIKNVGSKLVEGAGNVLGKITGTGEDTSTKAGNTTGKVSENATINGTVLVTPTWSNVPSASNLTTLAPSWSTVPSASNLTTAASSATTSSGGGLAYDTIIDEDVPLASSLPALPSASNLTLFDPTTLANSGDVDGLTAYDDVDEDTPLSGIWNFLNSSEKLIYTVIERIKKLDADISEPVNEFTENMAKISETKQENKEELSKMASEGDVSGVMKYDTDVDEDVPLAGLWNFLNTVGKFPYIISGGIKSIGNAIWDKVKDTPFGMKVTDITDYVSRLNRYTDPDKDMTGFDNEKFGDGKGLGVDAIISPIVRFSMGFYVNIVRAFKSIGKTIGGAVSNVVDGIGNFSGIGDAISSLAGGDSANGGTGPGVGKKRGGKGVTILNGAAYYSQNDPRWANKKFIRSDGVDDGATMSTSGCGPTAMAMVVDTMNATQDDINKATPIKLAKYAQQSGERDQTGTNWDFVTKASQAYGLSSSKTESPTTKYIIESVKSGNPVLLSGVDDGSGKTPYTSSGHYVVAVGIDQNGNILVNDPRGEKYSRAIRPSELAHATSAAWTFSKRDTVKVGGRGLGGNYRLLRGGRGERDTWIAVIQAVKKAIADQQPGYSQKNWITLTIGGRSLSVRTDCSGMVTACLKYYGAVSDSVNLNSTAMTSTSCSALNNAGFKPRAFTSWDALQEGDILAKNGHVEIFAGKQGDSYYVYNCGSDKSVNNPSYTYRSYKAYTTVWSPGSPGANCVTDLTITSTGLSPGSSVSYTTDSTSSISASASSSVDTGGDIFSRIGNIISNAASNMLDKIFRGDDRTTDTSSTDDTATTDTTGGSGRGRRRRGGRGRRKRLGGRGETLNGIPYYSQTDPEWANETYVRSDGVDDGSTMGNSGCGPTAMSMVLNSAGVSAANPRSLARLAQETGNRDDTGTNWNFIDQASRAYGVPSYRSETPTSEEIKEGLKSGSPMILSGQSDDGVYTPEGHYVVATKADTSGNVAINDPRGKSYSKKVSLQDLTKSTTAAWTFGGSGRGGRGMARVKNIKRGGRGMEYREIRDTGVNGASQYWIMRPFESKDMKLPMIIFLHGHGERGGDMYCMAGETGKFHGTPWVPKWFFDGDLYGNCVFIAPHLDSSAKNWSDNTIKSGLIALIQRLVEQENVDPDRIAIMGQSGGSIGAAAFVSAAPTMFSCCLLFCGYDTGHAVGANMTQLPILAFTGTADSGSAGSVRQLYNKVAAAGGNMTLFLVKDETHNSIVKLMFKYDFISWMLSQRRGQNKGTPGGVININNGDRINGIKGGTTNSYGTSVETGAAVDASTYSVGAGTSDTADLASGTLSYSSGSSSDFITKVGSAISAVSNKLSEAMLSGNLEGIDWKSVIAGSMSSDSSSSSSGLSYSTGTSGDYSNLTATSVTGNSNEEKAWNYLTSHGLTKAGAAGLLGNLRAESGVRPNNLQDTANTRLGVTDEEYTNRVNSGEVTEDGFVNHETGYGLAQWTTAGRKRNMYQAVRGKGFSIDDMGAQLDYLLSEMKSGYKSVYDTVTTTNDVKTASDSVLLKFEAPKIKDEAVAQRRASYGLGYYEKFKDLDPNASSKSSGSSAGSTGNGLFNQSFMGDNGTNTVGGGAGIGRRRYGGRGMKRGGRAGTQGDMTNVTEPFKAFIGAGTNAATGNGLNINNTNVNMSNDNMEALVVKALEILSTIAANSNNLSLLKDLSAGSVNTINNVVATNSGNGTSNKVAKKRDISESFSEKRNTTTYSTTEKTARMIAFGG